MRYYVVTGGPLTSKAAEVIKDGAIIAADKGIDFCFEHGFTPSLAVGDMDSISPSGLERLNSSEIPVKTFPVEKDMTDTELAISFVPEGEDLTVVCPLSGRIDHVTANIQLAAALHRNGRNIRLDDGVTEVRFLSGSDETSLTLDRYGDDSAVSLVPLSFDGNVTGVTTEGLYYPLNDAVISCGKTLTFSNKPNSGVSKIKVSIREGLMAVMVSSSKT
ncbi:MAG: thiamine diphosphokinase [Clostridiales bacterium]|nr:thiamine diphosphokinase [Clostridiales bacterium]